MKVASDIVIEIPVIMTTFSNPIDISQMWLHSFQFIWTGDPVGTVGIRGGNDGITFSDITMGDQPTGAIPGSHVINCYGAGYKWVQAQYMHTSGSGTMTCYYNAKGV